MREGTKRWRHEESFGPSEPHRGALRIAKVRYAKLETIGDGGAREGIWRQARGAAAANINVGGDDPCRHFRREVHPNDGFVYWQAPIMADCVPVKLIVIGQELQHAIRFVADDEAMVAGRDRRPGRDAQLVVSRIAALFVGNGRAVFAHFQNLDANARVFCVWADEAPVPTRFGIDGQVADHSVAEVIAHAVRYKLLAYFQGGVLVQRDIGGEREDAVQLHPDAAVPRLARPRLLRGCAPDGARRSDRRPQAEINEPAADCQPENELHQAFDGARHWNSFRLTKRRFSARKSWASGALATKVMAFFGSTTPVLGHHILSAHGAAECQMRPQSGVSRNNAPRTPMRQRLRGGQPGLQSRCPRARCPNGARRESKGGIDEIDPRDA